LFDANEALRDAIDAHQAVAPGTAPAPNVTQRIREAVRTAERKLADYNRRTEQFTTKDANQLSLAFDALPRLKAVEAHVRGAGNTAELEHAAETSGEEKIKRLKARLTSLRPADDAFGTELTEDVAYNLSWANELLAE
jgi:DNA helicase HerA-like ATPase